MIKVLYFMDGIGNAGGIQEMVINWLKYFPNKKIHVDILSYDTGKLDNYTDRVSEFGCEVYIIKTFTRRGDFFESINQTKEFFKNHHDYDILHCHASSKAYYILKYAKKYGIKIRILHSHCANFVVKNPLSLIAGKMLKPLANYKSTHYFACSTEAGNFLFGKKRMKQKGYFIPNGVNVDDFTFNSKIKARILSELNLQNKIIIGNVGRFKMQKNHDFLIDVFYKIYHTNPKTILLLVGDGGLL